MARASKPSPAAPATPAALASAPDRIWLKHQLAQAERDAAHGPAGEGWAHNEGKRAGLESRAAFLRALVALLPPLA